MLVLSRKPGENVVIGGGITVTVVAVNGNRVRLGIVAPDNVPILREELAFWQKEGVGVDSDHHRDGAGRSDPNQRREASVA